MPDPNPAPMAADLLTVEQREQFLGALREGIPHGLAARGLEVEGITGTKLRGVRRRDPEFRAEVEAALQEGKLHYRERLSAQARVRALNGSDRMLEVELATHVPGYEHLRRDKLTVDGRIENGLVLTPGVLERLPTELLQRLRDEYAAAEIVDGEFIELGGDDEGQPQLGPGRNGSR